MTALNFSFIYVKKLYLYGLNNSSLLEKLFRFTQFLYKYFFTKPFKVDSERKETSAFHTSSNKNNHLKA